MKQTLGLIAVLTLILVVASSASAGKTKVALVGDPIMGGYAAPLGELLGGDYEVKSFCANGVTVFKGVYRSVHSRYEARHAAAWKPDVVLFGFGANDGKPGNWQQKARYADDYKAVVAPFAVLQPAPKIYICLPPPCVKDHWGISAKLVNDEVVPAVRQIAQDLKAAVIDTHTPLKGKPGLHAADGVFLSPNGYAACAAICYESLTGKKPSKPVAEDSAANVAKGAAPAMESEAAQAIEKPLDGWKDKTAAAVVELKLSNILDTKGDGPDGKANTDDDTWGFWLQLAHAPNAFYRLGPNTVTMTPEQRANGITDPAARRGHQGKVRGPIAGLLPNPDDTNGWIFGTDWDGRFEGVWADTKASQILMAPFVEKHFHGAVAVSYRIPATGTYTISAQITDMTIVPTIASLDGVTAWIQVTAPKAPAVMVMKTPPVGDGGPQNGRPNTLAFKAEKVRIGGGRSIRFVIHPNANWGTDTTRIDYLKIEKLD